MSASALCSSFKAAADLGFLFKGDINEKKSIRPSVITIFGRRDIPKKVSPLTRSL
jgi:hypothetical protein